MQAKSNKKRRRWPFVLSAVLVILAVGGYLVGRSLRATLAGRTESSQTVAVSRQDLSVVVYGSGVLAAQDKATIRAPFTTTVTQVLVEPGDRVAQGDVLAILDPATISRQMEQLEEQMASLDQQIGQLSAASGSSRITVPASGRIKQLFVETGLPVQAVMAEQQALAVLSVDGYLVLEAEEPAIAVKPGDLVSVLVDGSTYSGHVERLSDGRPVILIADDEAAVGRPAEIFNQDERLIGNAETRIHKPVYITGTGGIITEIRRQLNEQISRGSTLFVLNETILPASYLNLIDQREQALAEWQSLNTRQDQYILTAPSHGIVAKVDLQPFAAVQEDQEVIVIEADGSYQIQVMVDELDIIDIALGQPADVSLAARQYAAYPARVTRISTIGSSSGGVTTYPVTLTLDESEGLFSGLTAGVDILVGRREQVLALPVAALKIDGARTYVTRISTDERGLQQEEDRVVTVGLVNESWAEIISGLDEGDHIIVQQAGGQAGFPNFRFR